MPDKPKYGGGAMFSNRTACAYFPWDGIKRKQDARGANPELSGTVEITKAFVKKMAEMFKEGDTQTSKRGDVEGQQVVVMDIAGLKRTSKSGLDYFSIWFSDAYKPRAETSSSDDDDDVVIPF
jgi:hypothetical protein